MSEFISILEKIRPGYDNGGKVKKKGEIYGRSGYKGYVSPERKKLEKKLPKIKQLYLSGLSIPAVAKELKADLKQIEVIIDELRGKSPLKKDGEIIGRGYAVKENTERGKLYKGNRISSKDMKARGRGGAGGLTSPKSKAVIAAAKEDAKTLTPSEIKQKHKMSVPVQRKYGIFGVPEKQKYKDKYLKPQVTKYGKKVLNLLEKDPSLITRQRELFTKAKIPTTQQSSVIRALNMNQTLDSGKKRFNISKNVSKLIPKLFGDVETSEDIFRQAGLSQKQIRSTLVKPGVALQEAFIPKGDTKSYRLKGTVFEHTFPRALIPFLKSKKLQKELLITGERTSPFLNSFKSRFDTLQKIAVNKFLQDGNLSEYNKTINNIKNTVKKITGGYEVGYIKFDKNGNATPIVNTKKVTVGLNDFGPETTQKISAFKNAKYTSNLLKNFKKDPNNINFSSLRKDVSANQISKDVIKLSDEAAKAYEKSKPFLTSKEKFTDFSKKNFNNKLVATLFKTPRSKMSLVTGASIVPNRLLSITGMPAPQMITALIPELKNPLAVDYSNMQLGTGRLAKSAGLLKNLAKIGGKALGIVAIPLEVANMLNMRKQGKTAAEILASPFFLSGRVAEAQDLMKMTPLERQAVSEQQIAGDESMLDTDFYTPTREGIEAIDVKAVQERVRKQREAEERQRALERARGSSSGFTYPGMYGITSVKGVI